MAAANRIKLVDTTIRDGQMSHWATAMTTDMILPLAQDLGAAGFSAIEVLGAAFFKKLVRELRDDPFERVRRIKSVAPDAVLRVIHSRHTAAFQITPPDIYRLWTEQLHASGVDEVRMSDPSNTVATWERNKGMAEAAGLRVIVNLVYSSSPKHTDDYYREKAKAAAALRPPIICLKDPGGLLTPDRMRTLVPTIQEAIGDIPLEFHGHCNNGLGLLNAMLAVELGIRIINTAIPPLANGASMPNVFVLATNLRVRGYDVDIDDERLERVSAHLEQIRVAHDLPEGRTAEFDETYYIHQVPGGMISNLRFQLGRVGMAERLSEVLDEVGRVREDLGYPIMVTPYSQFVGTQATLNVTTGKRYGQVVDEILQYALGQWGEEEAEGITPDVKDLLLSHPRAREVKHIEVEDISADEVRRRLEATDIPDDEFLLRFFTSAADVSAMRTSRPMSPAAVHDPWIALVERLAKSTDLRRVEVRKGSASLVLGR
jgi:oxaloacetate decarboxylase (Na+ extruding) subunit alpha